MSDQESQRSQVLQTNNNHSSDSDDSNAQNQPQQATRSRNQTRIADSPAISGGSSVEDEVEAGTSEPPILCRVHLRAFGITDFSEECHLATSVPISEAIQPLMNAQNPNKKNFRVQVNGCVVSPSTTVGELMQTKCTQNPTKMEESGASNSAGAKPHNRIGGDEADDNGIDSNNGNSDTDNRGEDRDKHGGDDNNQAVLDIDIVDFFWDADHEWVGRYVSVPPRGSADYRKLNEYKGVVIGYLSNEMSVWRDGPIWCIRALKGTNEIQLDEGRMRQLIGESEGLFDEEPFVPFRWAFKNRPNIPFLDKIVAESNNNTWATQANSHGLPLLHEIVTLCDSELMRWVLSKPEVQCNARTATPINSTPLHIASAMGGVEAVQILLDAGANIDDKDSGGRTALHIAACLGHAQVVQLLIERGADVVAEDGRGFTPLFAVCSKGDDTETAYRVHTSNRHRPESPSDSADEDQCKHADVVRALVGANCAQVNQLDASSQTTLMHFVLETCELDLVSTVLSLTDSALHDLMIAKDTFGDTPLHIACMRGDAEVTDCVLAKCQDLGVRACATNNMGRHPLHAFVANKDVRLDADIFDQLLPHLGEHINDKDKLGSTMLHCLLEQCALIELDDSSQQTFESQSRSESSSCKSHVQFEVLELVLGQPGVDVFARDANGRTCVDLLCDLQAQAHKIKSLVIHAMGSRSNPSTGDSALHLLIQHGLKSEALRWCHSNLDQEGEGTGKLREMLLAQNTSGVPAVLCRDRSKGRQLVHFAACLGENEIGQVVVQTMLDILPQGHTLDDVVDRNGCTALHLSTCPDFCSFLLAHGCTLDKRNNDGDTPVLFGARWLNHRGLEPLLRWRSENGTAADLLATNRAGEGLWGQPSKLHKTACKAAVDNNRSFVELFLSLDRVTPELANSAIELDDTNCLTLLEYACQSGRVDIVQLLLSCDKIVLNRNSALVNALVLAMEKNQALVVETMLCHPSFQTPTSLTKFRDALLRAVGHNFVEVVLSVVRHFPEYHKSVQGRVLHLAVRERHMEMVKGLLPLQNIDVNVADSDGRSVLFHAVSRNDLEMLDIFLESPWLDLCDLHEDSDNILDVAVAQMHEDAFVKLLKPCSLAGLDINARHRKGHTLATRIVKAQSTKMLAALLECPHLDLSVCDRRGRTALHWAAMFEDTTILQMLLDRANIVPLYALDKFGNLAFDIAKTNAREMLFNFETQRALSLAMGLHPRLGSESPLQLLPTDILRHIWGMVRLSDSRNATMQARNRNDYDSDDSVERSQRHAPMRRYYMVWNDHDFDFGRDYYSKA